MPMNVPKAEHQQVVEEVSGHGNRDVILFPREAREQLIRGEDERSGALFSYLDLEARIDQNHPLRMIRMIVNKALAALAGDFSALYSRMGRPSIQLPPARTRARNPLTVSPPPPDPSGHHQKSAIARPMVVASRCLVPAFAGAD